MVAGKPGSRTGSVSVSVGEHEDVDGDGLTRTGELAGLAVVNAAAEVEDRRLWDNKPKYSVSHRIPSSWQTWKETK